MTYAEIAVNAPLRGRPRSEEGLAPGYSHLAPTFHYSIPSHLEGLVVPGQLVRVPFGPRTMQGVVLALTDTSPVEETRDIEEIATPQPVLLPFQIELARWISRQYLSPLIDALLLMLPPGLGRRARMMISLVPDATLPSDLTRPERAILDYLAQEGETRLDLLPRRLKMPDAREAVEALVGRGLVLKRSHLEPPRVRPKRERVAWLKAEVDQELLASLKRAPKQRATLEYLAQNDGASVSEIYSQAGASSGVLAALEEKGLIKIVEEEVWRDPLAGRAFVLTRPPKLTPSQEAAYKAISASLDPPTSQVFLLHGVTGSGKTEIYLRVIEDVLTQREQAICLVPEIALTPQTIRRFGARFPNRIAVLHSKLSLGERYDTWRRIRDSQIDIVIGSRSAIFAPLPHLGLIVIDEEHEWSYKQEKTPRYHARDVAIKVGELTGATVVLGSATPDLSTYYRAERGDYRLLILPQRIMGHRKGLEEQKAKYAIPDTRYAVRELEEGYEARYMDLPPVQVVDLRQELRAGNRGIFSRALQAAMKEVLAAGEQVILFLNRRGAATFVMCRDCGHVIKCPRCQVPLTYHSAGEDLICHHCNKRTRPPTVCPNCQSKRIKYFGIGTQRVEAEVERLFPQARTIRWDRDTTGRKGAHEAILERFISRQTNVMVGTQMVAKGLDLPLVTLVGVVTADTALHLPDFRAGERTFQLLTQVAGRAGRSILGGKVIVQTYTPNHYAIQAASGHDYEAFYGQELAFRREQGYPPYKRLVRLIRVGRSYKRCQEDAERLYRLLENKIARLGLPGVDLIGPAPAFHARLRGNYRWHIIVRAQDPYPLLEDMPLPRGWRVDVDPVSVL